MKRKVTATQNVSRMCMVCGVENQFSLRGRFFLTESGELVGIFKPRPEHQGYPGRMHGGMVAALLDETIGRAVNAGRDEAWGVTVKFSMRLRRPVPLDREVKVVARITHEGSRKYEGTGEVVLDDGTVAAEAEGIYVKLPIDDIATGDFTDSDWLPDSLPAPEQVELGGE